MFTALGKLIYRRRWVVLGAGLIFIVTSAVASLNLSASLKVGGFIDPDGEAVRTALFAQQFLGRDQGTLVVLFTSRDGTTLDQPQYKAEVEATLAKINGQPGAGKIFSFYNTGLAQFVSTDRRSTYAAVGLPGDDDAQIKTVERLRPLVSSTSQLEVRLGGRPAVNEEIIKQTEIDLMRAELMTFPIVGLLLFLIFRSAVAALLPLIIGGTAILGAYLILRIGTNFTDISVFALNIITMLGLGLSIDYSLFVVSRFREELKLRNGNVAEALLKTMQTAGHTVFFSGMTVIISLLSLLVFEPQFLKSMGLGGSAAVLVAMLASMTILPAILALLGEKVNLLSVNSLLPGRRKRDQPGQLQISSFWYRTSQFVMRRPVVVLVVTLVPLLLIGSPFLRINFSTFDARTLPPSHAGRQVSDILQSQFPPNETTPIEIVVTTPGPALEEAGLNALFDYTRQLQALPGVRRIDSLVTVDPKLDKNAYAAFYSEAGRNQNPQAAGVAQRFANGRFTLISVVYQDDEYAATTQNLVRQIRQMTPPQGLQIQVGGETASLVDLLSSLGNSLPLAFALIVIVLFVLLYLMLGTLVVPFKAVILNILSLSACFGVLVWVFQDGYLSDILGFTPTGAIDCTQPVLIFAGAFGLSLDYEVFLLSRIKEHYDRTNDLRASVALGVQKTGGIITSAALLLVVVIGSFVTGDVLFIKQIGLGLAVAILVDATVVRTLLLPASMRLMGKYNWWAPAPLVALHARLGLGEVAHEAETGAVVPAPVLRRGPAIAGTSVTHSNSAASFPAAPPNSYRSATVQAPIVSNAVFQGAGVPDKERLLVSLRNETFGPAGKNVPVQVKVQQLNQLAELSQSLGREQEALGYYEQSLKLLRESGAGEQNQVIVLTQLSNLYLELHNQASGLRASLDGLRLSRQTGQVAAEFNFLVTLTGLYFKAEDLKQARFYAWQAFQLAQHRADANRQRRAERLLAQVDAREELQFNSQTFGSLKTLTGSFKQLTGSFKTLSPAPANTGPTPAAQAETFYERGKQLQAAKDYYQAIEAYRQALELNPQLVKAYVNRAVAFSAIHEYEAALKDYNRALGLEQHDPDIWFNRGNTYYFRHEYEAALADYNKALQLNPNDPDIWFNRGGLYRRIGQMDKAAADFHRVIELSQGRDEAGARQARNILAKMQQTIYNK